MKRCTPVGLWRSRLSRGVGLRLPAVLVAVEHDERLLLLRHAYAAADGRLQHDWELLAGFVEAGETLEGAAMRELWEETGLVAAQLTYTGSHPWSMADPAVLLVGFTAYTMSLIHRFLQA